MDIVVMPEEIRRDFPRHFELAVFPDYGLDLFDKRVFRVIAGDFDSSVVYVLKFPGVSELDYPRGDGNRVVRGRLIEADLQKDSILETSD